MKNDEPHNNSLPEGWSSEAFVDTIDNVKINRIKQVQANIYLSNGKYPVIDQGQELIAGWTNDESTVIKGGLPLIIFGDHTRIFKYVDFPFAIGADGTKIIKPQNRFNARFFYYYLLSLDVPSRGYSRHFKILKDKSICYPPLSEQKKIASVLFKIQQAIEMQDKLIEKTKELKKAVMEFLFTRGTRGEKTKMTEIGEIPESWEVGILSDLCDLIHDSYQPKSNSELKYIGLEHIESGCFFINNYGSSKDVVSSKNKFKKNDILYGKLRPYLDKVVIADSDGICSTDILVFRSRQNIHSTFLAGILHSSRFIDYAIQTTHGVNHPRTSWKSLKTYKLGISLSHEQEEIGKIINKLEMKISIESSKKKLYTIIFNSMLNKLMTGQIKIHDLILENEVINK